MTKPIVNVNVGGPTKPSCTYKTKVLKGNIPFAAQVSDEDTKYVIKFDFDLGGSSVTIPTGCLLEFDGGSLSNGTVVGQETILIYHQAFADILHDVTTEGTFVWDKVTTDDESIIEDDGVLQVNTNGILAKHIKAGEVTGAKLNADVVDDSSLQIDNNKIKVKAAGVQGSMLNSNVADGSSLVLNGNALQIKASGVQGSMLNGNVADDEDIHLTSENKLQLKDKAYAPAAFSGLGRKYLRKNIVSNKNVLTQAMMSEDNTIYVIQYDYDLNDPNGNSPIQIPANSVLKFDGGSIDNGKLVLNNASIESSKPCFGDNIQIEGKILQEASPEWFTGSDAQKIEKAIKNFKSVKLAARDYIIDTPIVVNNSFKLTGGGFGDFFGAGRDTSSVPRDYSASRLVAANSNIECIIDICRIESAHAYSVLIDGVSFVGYQKNNNGVVFSTPNAPSRPVSITNCNFKYFNHAIDVNDGGISNASTNVGVLNLTQCNITNNNYGIYLSTTYGLLCTSIIGNNLEANTECAIYANAGTFAAGLSIINNLLEGMANPIYIRGDFADIEIKGNWFETVPATHPTTTVKVLGNITQIANSKLSLSGNTCTSQNLIWDISKIHIELEEGFVGTQVTDKYKMDGCRVYGNFVSRLDSCKSTLFFGGIANSSKWSSVFCDYYFDKNAKVNGRYYKRMFSEGEGYNNVYNVPSINIKGLGTIESGVYRASCIILKSDSPDSNKINFYVGNTLYGNFVPYSMQSKVEGLFVTDINIETTVSATLNMQVVANNNKDTFLVSDLRIVKLQNDNRYNVPVLPDVPKNILRSNFEPYASVGLKIFDTSLLKELYWDGVTRKKYARQLYQAATATTSIYITNSISEGTSCFIEIHQFTSGQLSQIKVVFAKTQTSIEDGIEIPIDTSSMTGSGSSCRVFTKSFVSPDPTVYPYIYLNCPYTGVTFYHLYNAVNTFVDALGYTPSKHTGSTADRPDNLTIEDSGFEYFDKTLHLPVYYSASFNTSKWYKADGTEATS